MNSFTIQSLTPTASTLMWFNGRTLGSLGVLIPSPEDSAICASVKTQDKIPLRRVMEGFLDAWAIYKTCLFRFLLNWFLHLVQKTLAVHLNCHQSRSLHKTLKVWMLNDSSQNNFRVSNLHWSVEAELDQSLKKFPATCISVSVIPSTEFTK